MINHSESEEM